MRGLVDGRWVRDLAAAGLAEGFRDTGISAGIPSDAFAAEAGRYHLYVSYACPFAHLTLLARSLCGLEDAVSVSVCDPYLGGPDGWCFAGELAGPPYDGVTVDHLHGSRALYEIYVREDPQYTGRVSVPVLWDTHRDRMVSNYSTGIMRAFHLGLRPFATREQALFAEHLRPAITKMSQRVLDEVSYQVYALDDAATQADYEREAHALFDALDRFESELADGGPYLLGETLTEADLRLFVALVRFEPAYAGVFYATRSRVADYPALSAYVARVMSLPGVADTVRPDHIRRHYFDDDAFSLRRRRQADGRFFVPLMPRPPRG